MSKKHHKHEDEQNGNEESVLSAQQSEEQNPPAEQPAPAQPDYYEKYVRLSADFDNFRKRTEREKAALLAYGKKDFAEKLLPAYEVLLRQRAQMQKDATDEKCAAETKSLRDGLNMVLCELDKVFKAEGVARMECTGKPYDPMTQEAIAVIPAPQEQDGKVIEEVQMGFMIDGKVLRPARVVVGKAQEEPKETEQK